MAQRKTTPPSAEAWQVTNLRVTAFPSEPPRIEEPSLWTEVLGYPPEAVTSRPKAGQRKEEGEHEGRRLFLEVQPERIDWILTPLIKPAEDEPATLPLAGPFPEVLASFLKPVERWLPRCPETVRLAFGAVLAQPVENRRAGYVQIRQYLRAVDIDPDSSEDFFYQINRPRPSRVGIEGLRVNRLSKWSVLLFQRFSVTLEKSHISKVGYATGDSACRLELDINTAPDLDLPLPHDGLSVILGELVDLAKEIATNGDVP